MQTNILVGGSFHAPLLAKTLMSLGENFTIYTSATRNKFGIDAKNYQINFVPLIAAIIQRLTKINLSKFSEQEAILFDNLASLLMKRCDVLYGWAGYSLKSAQKAKLAGSKFVLERSCPHILFQENILEQEAEKLKIKYIPKSQSWINRSTAEYELADFIVVPSKYTYNSFIKHSYHANKIFIAELDHKISLPPAKTRQEKNDFVVGMLGGSLLRKGFIYLLAAWKKLNLPNAKLLLRASEHELKQSPIICEYLNTLNNVEIFSHYFNNINEFYQQCDVFCLPSVDEGFGMAVIEAMANSLPVIITENVGAKDLIVNQEFSFIIEPFNSDQIAEKIEFLYKNRGITSQLGDKAYKFVLAKENDKEIGEILYQKQIKLLYKLLKTI
ncbi:glycosyltransferase family 4 protein [Fortiea contorta]|uniref:glycosyltransferase family 4 protein n=1 Tax=Fortiea contorta TaxID=1892405 RepID=UPI00036D04B3|nr:glycosyltransferase family 4 protein [Fortiea contorta]